MTDPAIEEALKELFAMLDFEALLRALVYGGFDTFEDYEKYGDLFVPVSYE